ncbi:hypothetical protein [Secundilactobacillus kimchicus]|uniref:hypothetical protein n=1 Tax=Secundilactobacillus kimchicus TaxID=528209 RepID=UPI0024A8F8E5|nr:hypothetical protein [Secundilactobacillus kimchicus]
MDEKKESRLPEEDGQLNIEKRYLGNILGVSQISVTRVLVKTPTSIYQPDFEKDVSLWEQLWSSEGELLLERRVNVSKR